MVWSIVDCFYQIPTNVMTGLSQLESDTMLISE